MRMKIGVLAAVVGVMLALGASASRAAIVDTIIDTDSDTTVGSITFPTFTGDSDAGVLFSYGGFTQADITSISWSLDPTTAAVVALILNALQGDNPCPNGPGDCSNVFLNLSPTLATLGSRSCSFSGDSGSCEASERVADISFVAALEPSTWGHDGRRLRWPRPCGTPIDETGGRIIDGSHFVIPAQSGNPNSQQSVAGRPLSRACGDSVG